MIALQLKTLFIFFCVKFCFDPNNADKYMIAVAISSKIFAMCMKTEFVSLSVKTLMQQYLA